MTDGYKKAAKKLIKNKYVLILIAAGLTLMLLGGTGAKKKTVGGEPTVTESVFSVSELENRMSKSLSKIEGAGHVQVVLTVGASTEQVLAQDTETKSLTDGDRTESNQTVKTVIIDSGTDEAPVVTRYVYPEFRGAVIIAEGADNAAVRLSLTQAVSNLTGLGADRITVAKGSP